MTAMREAKEEKYENRRKRWADQHKRMAEAREEALKEEIKKRKRMEQRYSSLFTSNLDKSC